MLADGAGVDAHAPLLLHHVALLVELALHRMTDAAALHVSPQLQPVRRHAPEVLGRVLAGGGIHADRAVLLRDLGELVRDDILLRRRRCASSKVFFSCASFAGSWPTSLRYSAS